MFADWFWYFWLTFDRKRKKRKLTTYLHFLNSTEQPAHDFTFDFVAQHHDEFLRFVRDNSVVVVKDNLLDLLAPKSLLIETSSLHNNAAILSFVLHVAVCQRGTGSVFVTVWPWPFDLWVNACWLPSDYYSICVPCLVLIAQAVFLLEHGQTDRQTRLNAIPTPAAIQPAWVIIIITEH